MEPRIGNSDGSKDARSSANNYGFASEYGDNISDVRQSFNLSLLYELPFGKDQKYLANAEGLTKARSAGGNSARCSMRALVYPSMSKSPAIPRLSFETTRRASSPQVQCSAPMARF